jgi:hypothetical protein
LNSSSSFKANCAFLPKPVSLAGFSVRFILRQSRLCRQPQEIASIISFSDYTQFRQFSAVIPVKTGIQASWPISPDSLLRGKDFITPRDEVKRMDN